MEQGGISPVTIPVVTSSRRPVVFLVLTVFGLLGIIGGGLFLAFSGVETTPDALGWFVFSFVMGLTMIVLPCTLPLAFVIVPLSMGKGPRKGFAIALAFGIGIAITLSFYGVLAAVVGKVAVGTLNAPLETVKNWVYLVAGLFALLFALGELGFLKIRMPTYSGAAPMFIQKQGDVLKALLLGLFMGNIGVGCPHPATPLILINIAQSGDVLYGWLLFFVHALGRITPLLLLATLGILGVNALSWVVKRRTVIERATGWAMVFVAGFILVLGLFTHDWWVNSGIHTLLEEVTQEERFLNVVSGKLNVAPAHAHGIEEGPGLFGLPLWLGNWVLVGLWVAPLCWYILRRRKALAALTPEEQVKARPLFLTLAAFMATVSLLLAVVFAWALPQRFLLQQTMMGSGAAQPVYQLFITAPQPLEAGVPQELVIELKDAQGKPLTDLAISHERFVHVVIIDEELETLGHVHPEDFGPISDEMKAQSRYVVQYTFSKPGREYLIAVDGLHRGTHSFALHQRVRTAGETSFSVITKDLGQKKQFSSYNVSFNTSPAQMRSGEEVNLQYRFEENGQPVKNFEQYLGAPTHFSIVSVDLNTFIHTHGEVHDPETGVLVSDPVKFGPVIEGHVVFPHPGLYRIFGQVQREGQVLVTSFMVSVAPGANTGMSGAAGAHHE